MTEPLTRPAQLVGHTRDAIAAWQPAHDPFHPTLTAEAHRLATWLLPTGDWSALPGVATAMARMGLYVDADAAARGAVVPWVQWQAALMLSADTDVAPWLHDWSALPHRARARSRQLGDALTDPRGADIPTGQRAAWLAVAVGADPRKVAPGIAALCAVSDQADLLLDATETAPTTVAVVTDPDRRLPLSRLVEPLAALVDHLEVTDRVVLATTHYPALVTRTTTQAGCDAVTVGTLTATGQDTLLDLYGPHGYRDVAVAADAARALTG